MPDAAVIRLRSKINIDLVITELAILSGVNVKLFPSSPTHSLPRVYAGASVHLQIFHAHTKQNVVA